MAKVRTSLIVCLLITVAIVVALFISWVVISKRRERAIPPVPPHTPQATWPPESPELRKALETVIHRWSSYRADEIQPADFPTVGDRTYVVDFIDEWLLNQPTGAHRPRSWKDAEDVVRQAVKDRNAGNWWVFLGHGSPGIFSINPEPAVGGRRLAISISRSEVNEAVRSMSFDARTKSRERSSFPETDQEFQSILLVLAYCEMGVPQDGILEFVACGFADEPESGTAKRISYLFPERTVIFYSGTARFVLGKWIWGKPVVFKRPSDPPIKGVDGQQ